MDSRDIRSAVGQHFVVGFDGLTAPPALVDALGAWNLAGTILFRRNVADGRAAAEQVLALNRALQPDAPELPRIASVDQEGGLVARLRAAHGFTEWSGNDALGRLDDEAVARAFGTALGRELGAVGFNVDWAPVLDVHTNPANPIIGPRAFGGDPEQVARLGAAVLEGLREGGVLGCGKHFPGHGGTSTDSHHELPFVDDPVELLRRREIVPFARAIEAGVGLLMTAHVVYRTWDPAHPASMSRTILREHLRGTLGYEGVIVSDDLEMKAVSASAALPDIARGALAAGSDLLLVCRWWEEVGPAIDAVTDAYEAGELDVADLERSVARIRALRERLRPPPEDTSEIGEWVGCEAHRSLAVRIAGPAVA